jgi:hypothetical protein
VQAPAVCGGYTFPAFQIDELIFTFWLCSSRFDRGSVIPSETEIAAQDLQPHPAKGGLLLRELV